MIEAWIEWKKKCALGLCSEASKKTLNAFARSRFVLCLRRCSRGRDFAPHNDPWHLLETYMRATNTKQGKRYKDWLFARVKTSGDPPLDVIQGGASLVMRDVAREYLQRECAEENSVSINKYITGFGEGGRCLLDILPSRIDTASEIHLREYEKLADRHSREYLNNISRRQRIAVIAKRLGVSLAHRLVVRLAGCRKSALNRAYHELMSETATVLRTKYHDDGPESIMTICLMTVQKMSEDIFTWGESEISLAPLFKIGEG